jgi:methionine synthase II (cobalamin-independent)
MKRSRDCILPTHVGSLARPKDLLEMMDAKLKGKSYDSEAYDNRVFVAQSARLFANKSNAVLTSSPGFWSNQYYRTDEEFQYALAEALRAEYLAIVDAGFILQINDPSLTRLLISRTGNYDSTLLASV